MSKDEKKRYKIGDGKIEGDTTVVGKTSDCVKFLEYCIMSKDISILTTRVKREKHASDAFVFQVMCSGLNLKTGLCHYRQKHIVDATGLSKSEISKAVKRLSTPLQPDLSKPAASGFIATAPELIREYEDENGLRGYALHPDLVTIGGDKWRADLLWKKAAQQAKDKAEKAAQAAINAASKSSSLAEELDNIIAEQDIDFL